MKKSLRLPIGLAVLALLACSYPLRADSLTVQLDQSTTLSVPLGTTEVTFSGTIANPSADTVYLNGDNTDTSSLLVSVDDTPFLSNAPYYLDPGESSLDVELFDVFLDPSTPGSYSGSFSILGGPDGGAGSDFSDLVDIQFMIDVTSPVAAPEPGTLLLLGCGILGIVALTRRNRGQQQIHAESV